MQAIEAAIESSGMETLIEGIHKDWQKLQRAASNEEWTKDTAVPAKFFGSLRN